MSVFYGTAATLAIGRLGHMFSDLWLENYIFDFDDCLKEIIANVPNYSYLKLYLREKSPR